MEVFGHHVWKSAGTGEAVINHAALSPSHLV